MSAGRIGDIARRLLGTPNKKGSSSSQLRFGNNGSIAVDIAGPKAGEWYDHENQIGGGERELIRDKGDIAEADIPAWLEREGFANGHDRAAWNIVATYDYRDENGGLLFEVCRLEPKTFRQRRPDGRGGWEWKTTGTRKVPYRLPELVKAAAAANGNPWPVYIVEGEKDCDRLAQWGLIATTNPGGAGKWQKEFNHYFAGADVAIIPDNDEAGRQHAQSVAEHLARVAADVRIVPLQGLPDKGDISDWIARGGSQSDLQTTVEHAQPYQAETFVPKTEPGAGDVWEDDDDPIPPRGWLLANTFCRQFLSGLIADGGTGKTALRIAQYLSCATSQKLTGEHVFVRCRVLVICLEDGRDELRRRLRAARRYYGIPAAAVKGWLYLWTPRGIRLTETGEHGNAVIGELDRQLREQIKRRRIDIVGIDPFVKSHNKPENDNAAIDVIASLLAGIAQEYDCASDVVHHTRKGPSDPGNADAGRGAIALKDAARIVDTLTPMSREEADLFGLDDQERRLLIRLDNGKANLVPRGAAARWFKLVGVNLDNASETYPSGDEVQTVEPWTPPDLFRQLDTTSINQILDRIEAGPEPGRRFSPAPQAKDRAAWRIVREHCPGLTEKQAKNVIATWLKTGVLAARDYDDPKAEHPRKGVFVIKRPGNQWDA